MVMGALFVAMLSRLRGLLSGGWIVAGVQDAKNLKIMYESLNVEALLDELCNSRRLYLMS
jgi:hypothetical protein